MGFVAQPGYRTEQEELAEELVQRVSRKVNRYDRVGLDLLLPQSGANLDKEGT